MTQVTDTVSITKDSAIVPKIMHLFLNSMGNCRYTFPNGKDAVFLNGEYYTDIPQEIYHLNDEIASGHPYLSIDQARKEVDVTARDPMEALRKKIIDDYEAQKAALRAGEHTNAPSESDKEMKLIVGNSTTAAEATSGSTSVAGAPAIVTATTAAPAGKTSIIPGPKA